MSDTTPAPEEAKPAPAGDAPAAKPAAAKPAAKPKVEKKPLVDNKNGTITDPNSGLMWKQTDAWLDMHQFYTWQNHQEYVDKVNKDKFAGFEDWRLPTKAEATSIFDKDKTNLDKNGVKFCMDPIFASGGASSAWISECSDDSILRFDFKIGSDTAYPGKDVWASMWLVRDAQPKQAEAPAEDGKSQKKAAAS